MADLWVAGYEHKPMKSGGVYDETAHPKLGWHTWESTNWMAAENAFRKYPPHLAVFPPWPGKEASVGKRQYVPLNHHAYAFAGNESDDEYVIQVEVAGFAKQMRHTPDVVLEWLAREVVMPLERAVGIPRIIVKHGFQDAGYLATKTSKIRLSLAELRNFSGHLGHQHMPSPDTHWDPGALPIQDILEIADGLDQYKSKNGRDVEIPLNLAVNDHDERAATVRALMWKYWGRGPKSVDEHNIFILQAVKGADAILAAVVDHPENRMRLN